MSKVVSVIVPCYNGECFVDRCLASIDNQNYPLLEIIVVNDGSTDQSENVILEWKEYFEKKNIQLIYIFQKNKGSGGAINTGLKYVSGEYLSLLDADDEYLPEIVAKRVEFLECNEDIDVVRSNGWYVRESRKSLFINSAEEKAIDDVFSALIEGRTNNWAGSYMVRTSALFRFYQSREIYQSRYGQNLQILLPLIYQKKCGYIDEPHMNYIQQEHSLSNTTDLANLKKFRLENAEGYREIRVHMICSIVKSKEERERYLHILDVSYHRGRMQIALSLNDSALMRAAYMALTDIVTPSINDRIICNRLICPIFVPILRGVRKLKTIIRKFNFI